MLNVALNYIHVFDRLAKKEKICFSFRPIDQDWEFARYLCDRLKLFYDTTELLSGTSYVTSNLFFPKVCGIYLAIQKWEASDNSIIESMSAAMKEKFMKYWMDVHGLTLHDGSLTATYGWLLKRPSATYSWSLKTFSDP